MVFKMPTATVPLHVPRYIPAPLTNIPLEYADLPIIDLSKASTPEGRAQLAKQLCDALSTQGFFYVINHGLAKEEADRMFDIANVPFDQVGEGEKQRYVGDIKQGGTFQGYKLRKYWNVANGVRDQIENYSIHREVNKRSHPESLRPLLPEIAKFAQFNHFNVLHPLLRLLALGLNLPEEALVDIHRFDAPGESYDIGSLTLLWSQPVSALQILSKEPDGSRKWKWIKHIENALVVNAGNTLSFLSGGKFQATIHRVVQPPEDQRRYTRLGLIYFAMTDDEVVLRPLPGLPVDESKLPATTDSVTMEAWRKGRTSAYGVTELKKGEETGVEEQIVGGVIVKHYN